MKEYLWEMHAHTSEVSVCAHEDAESLLHEYTAAGYDGVVLTNHMNPWTFSERGLENVPWEDKVTHFLSGYRKLIEIAGGKLGVLLGMEIRFYDHPNDYLVYGVTEDFLYGSTDLMALTAKRFSTLAHENGFLFIQAHPFRRHMQVEDWKLLDGYEVFNGNPRHYSNNEIAASFAKAHGKTIVTSGSDFHETEDTGNGGIWFQEPIHTNSDLLRALRGGAYRLKQTDFVHTRKE